MKIFNKIIGALQLKVKWVRIMIIASIIVLGIIFIIPEQHPERTPIKAMREMTMESIADSTAVQPIVSSPIEIKIVNEEKEEPFDWKGTITWAIGALNGIILVILNIKNILKKK